MALLAALFAMMVTFTLVFASVLTTVVMGMAMVVSETIVMIVVMMRMIVLAVMMVSTGTLSCLLFGWITTDDGGLDDASATASLILTVVMAVVSVAFS